MHKVIFTSQNPAPVIALMSKIIDKNLQNVFFGDILVCKKNVGDVSSMILFGRKISMIENEDDKSEGRKMFLERLMTDYDYIFECRNESEAVMLKMLWRA